MIEKLIAAPTDTAITADDLKTHARIEIVKDDVWISAAILAATEYVENLTRRALMPQTWEFILNTFPITGAVIELPKPPLRSVTSVQYIDTAGVTQVWAAAEFIVDIDSERGRIFEAFGECYPCTQEIRKAVTIQFQAGYANKSKVPQSIKYAMYMLISHWYEQRETAATFNMTEVPFTVTALLSGFISQRFPTGDDHVRKGHI